MQLDAFNYKVIDCLSSTREEATSFYFGRVALTGL